MTKAALVERLAVRIGQTKSGTEHLLKCLVEECRRELKNGGEVALTGLGKFKVVHQKARTGHNPRDGSPITLPARNKAKFLPAKALREEVAR